MKICGWKTSRWIDFGFTILIKNCQLKVLLWVFGFPPSLETHQLSLESAFHAIRLIKRFNLEDFIKTPSVCCLLPPSSRKCFRVAKVLHLQIRGWNALINIKEGNKTGHTCASKQRKKECVALSNNFRCGIEEVFLIWWYINYYLSNIHLVKII